uniref:Cyclin-dependent kinases regulatory subunit n=1 Tax=Haemonchus contortus TaxID=6289 RepID=A0A7I4Z6V6_HAECO
MGTSQDERLKEIIKKKKKVAAGLAIKHRWLKSKRLMSVKQIKSLCNKKKSKKIDLHHASSVPHEPTEKPILKKEVEKSEPRVIPLEPVQEGQKSVRPLSMKPKSSQQLQKPASSRPFEMRPVPPPLPKLVPKKEVPKASDITAPKKESSVLTKPSTSLTKKPKDFRELFASIPFEPPRRVVPPPYPCWVDGRFQSGCVERVELKPLAKADNVSTSILLQQRRRKRTVKNTLYGGRFDLKQVERNDGSEVGRSTASLATSVPRPLLPTPADEYRPCMFCSCDRHCLGECPTRYITGNHLDHLNVGGSSSVRPEEHSGECDGNTVY